MTGAGAFAAVVLLSGGSRRRYGVYNDPNDPANCAMLRLGLSV